MEEHDPDAFSKCEGPSHTISVRHESASRQRGPCPWRRLSPRGTAAAGSARTSASCTAKYHQPFG
eukprot:1326576-Pyramimonas_sp.AAC.1